MAVRAALTCCSSKIGTKRASFRRPLHLDEFAAAGHDDVEIDLGPNVLAIVEVDQHRTVDDADTYRRHAVDDRRAGPRGVFRESSRSRRQRAMKPPVMLAVRVPPSASQHVAIDGDRARTQGRHVDRRPQAAADEPLDFLAATVDLAPLPLFARGRAAGEHAVFGRHPAGGVFLFGLPGRDPFVDAGRAQHGGAAGLNQDAARRTRREVRAER